MTPSDEDLRVSMQAFADRQQPPPLGGILDRPAPVRPLSRHPARVALLAVAVLVIIAGMTAVLVRPVRHGNAASIAAEPSRPAPALMAPACPPDLPQPAGAPFAPNGRPRILKAGQQVSVTAHLRAETPDRSLISYGIWVLPAGVHHGPAWIPGDATTVAHTEVRLRPGQRSVTLVVRLPADLRPGTYQVDARATYPGPSICGHHNPSPPTMIGTEYNPIGWVTIK